MNTKIAHRRFEWMRVLESAQMDYDVTMRTAWALPAGEFMRLADRLYADLHVSDQARRKAARMMEG